jgi:predicted CXXCH cytochrome family protein
VATIAACTDEKIVEVERPPFNPPADASSGFLGYYDAATKQTTCGNCHTDFQAGWEETAHAGAYATLKANPGAQDACYSCHTVTANGNDGTGTIGHDKVKDATYYDVQCESCHGQGLEHVKGVNQGQLVRPLAQFDVGPDTTAGCGSCHTGAHQPFVEQWSKSPHATKFPLDEYRSPCWNCHEGRKAVESWGETANYKERTSTTPMSVALCSTCHDPHGGPNSGQLRWPINTDDPAQNLCIKCHWRGGREVPTAGSSRGNSPHAPQGAVLLGDAGYRAAGYEYPDATSHRTRNPKYCAGCHVNMYSITDPASGNFVFNNVGHTFLPTPCVDTKGIPTGGQDCAYTTAARSWKSCALANCHGAGAAGETTAKDAFVASKQLMEGLVSVLWVDGDKDESVDIPPTDTGYLPVVKRDFPGQLNPSDQIITAADGAEFNAKLCAERYGNGDKSKGVHNPFLCRALLLASTDEMKKKYNLPSPPAEVQQMISEVFPKTPR